VRAGGKIYEGTHFISSIAIRDWIARLEPPAPPQLQAAREKFKYRDFVTVALMLHGSDIFPDNWIYVHDPEIKAGRVQNYKNWSAEMTPSADLTCLGVEYFCNQSDTIWQDTDQKLIELATREVVKLGLVRKEDILDGAVVRMEKAYPVYDETYREGLATVREFLTRVPNLQLVGRNGMHRYNNQDHSMLTAVLAARNIAGAHFNLWDLSVDMDYLETAGDLSNEELAELEVSQPSVPRKK
jgi:protoporphyrinogen oxidase